MIVGKASGFDSTKTGVQTRNRAAFLFGFLGQLGTDTFKSIADRGVGGWNVLIAVVNFNRAVVVQGWHKLVHEGIR